MMQDSDRQNPPTWRSPDTDNQGPASARATPGARMHPGAHDVRSQAPNQTRWRGAGKRRSRPLGMADGQPPRLLGDYWASTFVVAVC
jgi:hypothetical protein